MRIWIPKNFTQIVLNKPFGKLQVEAIDGNVKYAVEEHQDFYSVSTTELTE